MKGYSSQARWVFLRKTQHLYCIQTGVFNVKGTIFSYLFSFLSGILPDRILPGGQSPSGMSLDRKIRSFRVLIGDLTSQEIPWTLDLSHSVMGWFFWFTKLGLPSSYPCCFLQNFKSFFFSHMCFPCPAFCIQQKKNVNLKMIPWPKSVFRSFFLLAQGK